jgi:6 kDa early secretory antigenic target
MAVYSVDSDAVLSATAAVRGTSDRITSDTQAMLSQLGQLQSSWTGAAAGAFQSVIDRWRAMQHDVQEALDAISAALADAGRQYAAAEEASAHLFR